MTFDGMGPWAWLIGGLLLCAAETLAPGVFLLWIGLAAMATGLALFVAPLSMAWTLMLFGALAVVGVLLGRKFYGSLEREGDRPFLNRRIESMVGRSYVLEHAIKGGEGRIRVNDSVWRVRGRDMPAGVKVTVTGIEDGTVLLVEQA